MNLGDLVTVQTSSIIIFHLCDHRCLRTIPDESTRKSHRFSRSMFENFRYSWTTKASTSSVPLAYCSVTKCLNYTPSSSCGLHSKKSSGITVSLSEMTLSDPLFWSFENWGFHHCLGVAGCQKPMVFQWGFDHRFSPTCPGTPSPPSTAQESQGAAKATWLFWGVPHRVRVTRMEKQHATGNVTGSVQ